MAPMEQGREPQEPAEEGKGKEKQGADAKDEPVDVDSAILAHLSETQEGFHNGLGFREMTGGGHIQS